MDTEITIFIEKEKERINDGEAREFCQAVEELAKKFGYKYQTSLIRYGK